MDLHTKAVLTVIAAALCALVAQNTIGTSRAQSGSPQRVILCDPDSDVCATVKAFNTTPKTNRGSLSIRQAE